MSVCATAMSAANTAVMAPTHVTAWSEVEGTADILPAGSGETVPCDLAAAAASAFVTTVGDVVSRDTAGARTYRLEACATLGGTASINGYTRATRNTPAATIVAA